MSKSKKGQKKQQADAARNKNDDEYVSMSLFQDFQSEVWEKIDMYEKTIKKFKEELNEKDEKIKELSEENSNFRHTVSEEQSENQEILKSLDCLERQIKDVEAGFILSGKDYHESNGKEYIHFESEFKKKILEVAAAKKVELPMLVPKQKGMMLRSIQIGNSQSYLTQLSVAPRCERAEAENFILRQMFEGKGVFKWKGLDGKDKIVFIKRNRSFIDRKISQLMYTVFQNIEAETGEKPVKKWTNGKLFLNGTAVELVRSVKKVQAIMEGSIISEVRW